MKAKRRKLSLFDDWQKLHEALEAAAEKQHPGVTQDLIAPDDSYGETHYRLVTSIHDTAAYELGDDVEYYCSPVWDWYGATFDAYVNIASNCFTWALLESLQNLLTGEFKDWMIVARLFRDIYDADCELGEIAIVSDDILLLRETYEASELSR